MVWIEGSGLGWDTVTCSAPAMDRGSCRPCQEPCPSGGSSCSCSKCAGPQLNPGLPEGKESHGRWDLGLHPEEVSAFPASRP